MKVKAIRRVTLPEPVPVYDLSVPGPENFKLFNGPFVHNSKDIADALAGVAYGVTTRRELWAIHGVPLGQVPASISTVLKQKTIEDAKKNAGIHA